MSVMRNSMLETGEENVGRSHDTAKNIVTHHQVQHQTRTNLNARLFKL